MEYIDIIKWFKNRGVKTKIIFFTFLTLLPFLVYANYYYNHTCRGLVSYSLKQGIWGLRNTDKIKNVCWESIKANGDYRELYAYYKIYKFVDDLNKDKGTDNIYHWMLFYANENSRQFDSDTQSFKKEAGLYEDELKYFEEQMTQEEKIKSFHYIADNLATGTEGWVKKNDYHKSFEYLKRAAEAGDVFAQAELGACYFGGGDSFYKFEFPPDHNLAYKWTYLSTLHSSQTNYQNDLSKKMLKLIAAKITLQQIADAKKDAYSWIEKNQDFINRNPLSIQFLTKEQIRSSKKQTEAIIKKYNMYQPDFSPTQISTKQF